MGTRGLPDMYTLGPVAFGPWVYISGTPSALGPAALGPRVYISGKLLAAMLQLLNNSPTKFGFIPWLGF